MLVKHKNPLLIKDEDGKSNIILGQVKQSTYDLPSDKHIYGKKIIEDP